MNGSLDGDFRLSYRHDRCRIISWYSQHPVDGICFVPVLVYSLVQIGRSCGRCSYTRAPFISVRPICFYMAARSIQKSIGIEKKEKKKNSIDDYICVSLNLCCISTRWYLFPRWYEMKDTVKIRRLEIFLYNFGRINLTKILGIGEIFGLKNRWFRLGVNNFWEYKNSYFFLWISIFRLNSEQFWDY